MRFIAVYGASGSGKSSLVRAGLLPAWRRFSNENDAPVMVVKPDELGLHDPFLPFTFPLKSLLDPGLEAQTLAETLRNDPSTISIHIDRMLRDRTETAEFLLIVDQFEELFTTVDGALRQPFAVLLGRILAHPRTRIIITVRSDYFHYFKDYPELTQWLNRGNGHFLVEPLGPEHYRALIETPAKLAGFGFEDGLVDRLLADAQAGGSPEGLVPLMEFALLKLYQHFVDRRARGENLAPEACLFTHKTYQTFGGIGGAVGAAADEAMAQVDGAAEALPRLFGALVTMDAERNPARRRASLAELDKDPVCAALVRRMVGDQQHARLLVTDQPLDEAEEAGNDDNRRERHVEVAHEVLFKKWQAMADWIKAHEYDLLTRDRMIFEAKQWEASGRKDSHLLWPHERQQSLYAALERLGQPAESWQEEPAKSFFHPEAERLFDEIADSATDHQRRDWIGARWAAIDDPRPGLGIDNETGLPEILWSEVIVPGEIDLEEDAGHFKIEQSFKVAVYPVTRDQYTAFLDAGDAGYDNDRWWKGGLERPEPRWPPTGAGGNYPVGLVTWDEVVAYCRWLDHHLHASGHITSKQQIRLPTEWEWQLAATGGDRNREFPWLGPWDPKKLNSVESGLMRTTAVGLYPAGAAPCGALDIAGNSWQWCLNKYEDPNDTTLGGKDTRVLRGGSWLSSQDGCRAAYRDGGDPDHRGDGVGFRLCLSSPIVKD